MGKYRRGVYSVLWRAAGSGFLGLALVGAVVGYVSFDSFSVPSLDRIRQVSAAVVFTGQFERVDVGLRLADAGDVPRLYISGVNGNAGIDPAHFVEQFSIRNPDIADLRRLVACCVEWGERADNTFQNAQDTKCWVDRRGLTGPLLLITSRRTLARATAALSGALPDRVIVPYPVEDGPPEVGRNEDAQVPKISRHDCRSASTFDRWGTTCVWAVRRGLSEHALTDLQHLQLDVLPKCKRRSPQRGSKRIAI